MVLTPLTASTTGKPSVQATKSSESALVNLRHIVLTCFGTLAASTDYPASRSNGKGKEREVEVDDERSGSGESGSEKGSRASEDGSGSEDEPINDLSHEVRIW